MPTLTPQPPSCAIHPAPNRTHAGGVTTNGRNGDFELFDPVARVIPFWSDLQNARRVLGNLGATANGTLGQLMFDVQGPVGAMGHGEAANEIAFPANAPAAATLKADVFWRVVRGNAAAASFKLTADFSDATGLLVASSAAVDGPAFLAAGAWQSRSVVVAPGNRVGRHKLLLKVDATVGVEVYIDNIDLVFCAQQQTPNTVTPTASPRQPPTETPPQPQPTTPVPTPPRTPTTPKSTPVYEPDRPPAAKPTRRRTSPKPGHPSATPCCRPPATATQVRLAPSTTRRAIGTTRSTVRATATGIGSTVTPSTARPSPTPTGTSINDDGGQRDYPALIKRELDKLPIGRVLFNPPSTMTVGQRVRVVVRIARDAVVVAGTAAPTADLSVGLTGPGEPQVEPIKVASFMKVRLTGDDFKITTLNNDEQLVGDDTFTQWAWDIEALRPGDRLLHLVVSVRIKIEGDGEEVRDYPVLDKSIAVTATASTLIAQFLGRYWQWIIGTLVAVLGVLLSAIGAWPQLRPLAGIGRRRRRGLTYADFTMQFDSGSPGADPDVRVDSPAGQGRGSLALPATADDIATRLASLGVAVRSSTKPPRSRRGSRDASLGAGAGDARAAVEEVGRALFDALIAKDVRLLYEQSRGRLIGQSSRGLRLRLCFDLRQPDVAMLARLPWEVLYDPERGDFVSLNRLTPIVRFLDVGEPIQRVKFRPPLRICVVVSSPRGSPSLNLARERERIEAAWGRRDAVEVVFLTQATTTELRRALVDEPFHVLHFMGHGGFDAGTGTGVLLFEDLDGGPDPVAGRDLATMLLGISAPQLVILNACQTARAADDVGHNAFAGVATALVAGGLPAVVAMQFPISDAAAIAFSGALYQRLAAMDPVDAAVAEGRMAIYLADRSSLEWGTPALFMRTPDGRLFT